jgi:hypothetical protein
MKKYLEILKKCELFRRIEDENLLRMLTCLGARVEFFDKKYTKHCLFRNRLGSVFYA